MKLEVVVRFKSSHSILLSSGHRYLQACIYRVFALYLDFQYILQMQIRLSSPTRRFAIDVVMPGDTILTSESTEVSLLLVLEINQEQDLRFRKVGGIL